MCPVRWFRRIGYDPSDVPDQLFVDGVVGEAVGEVHVDALQGRHGEVRAHALVGDGLFGTGVVLDDVPFAQHLQKET